MGTTWRTGVRARRSRCRRRSRSSWNSTQVQLCRPRVTLRPTQRSLSAVAGDRSDGDRSGEAGLSYADTDIDLTHTRALANALGLLRDTEEHGEGSTTASSELQSQWQEQSMREYEAAQQAMLLSQQHAILEACRPSAINTQNDAENLAYENLFWLKDIVPSPSFLTIKYIFTIYYCCLLLL